MSWKNICKLEDIIINSGRAVLFNGEQVAIFRIIEHRDEKLFAISNFDPFSNANVISRGITGNLENKLVVASPLYKQHFCLTTGKCLEDNNINLKIWPIQLKENYIQLKNC